MALIQPVEDGKIPKDTSTTSKSDTSNDLGYDQFLQLLCAEMQYQDPLEPTSNTEYVAQLATFSQMESMLNMQNSIESTKANDLVGKYVIVKTTSETTGETTAVAGFVDYVQYENNQKYIYVNGNRYSLDDVYQVADTEYMEAVSLAEAFKASVAKLPDADKLTLAYQQSYIDSDTLATFVKLDGTMKSLVFDNALSQIPSADELTLENKEAVEALRKNYDSLTTTEKTYISKDSYDQLTALEAKIAELEKKAE